MVKRFNVVFILSTLSRSRVASRDWISAANSCFFLRDTTDQTA